jgi:hypothetical protein
MSCMGSYGAAAAVAGALVDVLTGSSAADDSSFVVGRSLLGTSRSGAAAAQQSTGGVSEASVRAANIAILWTSIGLGAVLQVSMALCTASVSNYRISISFSSVYTCT